MRMKCQKDKIQKKIILCMVLLVMIAYIINPPLVILGRNNYVYFTQCTELDLSHNILKEGGDIQKLRYFKKLKLLDLRGTCLHDNIDFVRNMSDLECLSLGTGRNCYNGFSPVDFTPLYDVNLRRFKGVSIDKNGFDNLTPLILMSNLESLEFVNMDLSSSFMEQLGEVKQINSLSLCGCNVQDFSPLSNLEKIICLDISSTNFQDSNIIFISDLPELEHLNISNTFISNFDFLMEMPSLKKLELSQNTNDKIIDELCSRGIEVIYH